jgi:Uncharacterized protein conserved in bacteria
MPSDPLDYQKLLHQALFGVVRSALAQVARAGLPPRHQFYITFNTGHPGVEIADWLKAKYPEEMTIVIQHQFWGLEVAEDSFSITLSFNKTRQRLVVPFSAVTRFVDPPANFTLQLGAELPGAKPLAPLPSAAGQPPAAVAPQRPAEPAGEAASAKVVSLESFRKS